MKLKWNVNSTAIFVPVINGQQGQWHYGLPCGQLPEIRGITFLQKPSTHLPECTVSYLRISQNEHSAFDNPKSENG
jgi:hypothetical protein